MSDYINIALPKGRLGEKAYKIFQKIGYEQSELCDKDTRKLIFENAEKKVRFFWAKPSDVAIYVERGSADIGVVGKDILLEYQPDIFELCDLEIGKCRLMVAGEKGFRDRKDFTLRVATKFPNVAMDYYAKKGRDIDVIKLNGSIELAPILKMSDVIVDIVETGTTLKENNLEVLEIITEVSARLVANKSSYQFNNERINGIVNDVRRVIGENK